MNDQAIYTRGTKMADIRPDARGISWWEYQRRCLEACAAAVPRTQTADDWFIPAYNAKAQARANYGWRSSGR